MRHLSVILTVPLAIVAVLFAISNRETVTFALWPLPFTLEAPLYLATLVALVIGIVVGGLIGWLGQHGSRRRARVQADRAEALDRELREARARAATAEKRIAELTTPVSGQPRAAAPAAPAAGLPVPAADRGTTAPTVH